MAFWEDVRGPDAWRFILDFANWFVSFRQSLGVRFWGNRTRSKWNIWQKMMLVEISYFWQDPCMLPCCDPTVPWACWWHTCCPPGPQVFCSSATVSWTWVLSRKVAPVGLPWVLLYEVKGGWPAPLPDFWSCCTFSDPPPLPPRTLTADPKHCHLQHDENCVATSFYAQQFLHTARFYTQPAFTQKSFAFPSWLTTLRAPPLKFEDCPRCGHPPIWMKCRGSILHPQPWMDKVAWFFFCCKRLPLGTIKDWAWRSIPHSCLHQGAGLRKMFISQ